MGWIDYGQDDDLLWIVFLQKNGECWIYPIPHIRACPNATTGRLAGISSEKLSKSIGAQLSSPNRKGKKESPLPARHARNGHVLKKYSEKN